MARIKYFYNTETCRYERVRTSGKNIVINLLGLFSISLVFAVLLIFGFNAYFDTEAEAALKTSNNELELHLTSLQTDLDDVEQMLDILNKRNTQIYFNLYNAAPGKDNLVKETSLNNILPIIHKKGINDPGALNKVNETVDALNSHAEDNLRTLKNALSTTSLTKNDLLFLPTILPVKNARSASLYSGFGTRINPFHHGVMFHEGMDFTFPEGTPVIATASGTVSLVRESNASTGYGNQIEIDHGSGIVTKYAHLSEMIVKKGVKVAKGEVIGYVGKTGGTIASCVHYEIIKNSKKVNPVNYIAGGFEEGDYTMFLELAFRENQSMD
ncbi:MAG: M23 family metallopeptidase [Cyclobacteriaceae bacterium]|nr:M23 family metallopeptidase [Cyclobacteriaceae bacterium]